MSLKFQLVGKFVKLRRPYDDFKNLASDEGTFWIEQVVSFLTARWLVKKKNCTGNWRFGPAEKNVRLGVIDIL